MRTKTRHVYFALAVAAVALFAGRAAFAQTAGAVRTVNAFYGWYLSMHGNWTNLSGARPYLTSSLYASLAKVDAEQAATHEAMLDFDPFSGAQAEAAAFTTGTPAGNGNSASVPVRIRLSGGNGSSVVRAVAVRGPSGWKIDNFIYSNGAGDLKTVLRQALK